MARHYGLALLSTIVIIAFLVKDAYSICCYKVQVCRDTASNCGNVNGRKYQTSKVVIWALAKMCPPVYSMEWIDFPDDRFVVNGLWWWDEHKPKLQRLPDRMQEDVPEAVWRLAQQPSGGRVRFATDSADLSIRAHFPCLEHMNNMCRIGQISIDPWVDGKCWSPVFPVSDDPDVEGSFGAGKPVARREVCLYLGLYAPVQIRSIGLTNGASIWEPAPFAVDKPVAYYGSSITQGGCATRPGLSYQAIVSRKLNLDFVNLGWSGAGRGETALAEAMAEIDASCYVIDFCQNCPTAEFLEEVYAPFLQTIRDRRPDTPMVCITPIYAVTEVYPGADARKTRMREVIREAVAKRQDLGDTHIELVEGFDLLGPDEHFGIVDSGHPNDIGFMAMAEGLEPVLRRILLN